MKRLLILSALLTVGCASLPATTSTNPNPEDVQQLRATSIRVMGGVEAAAEIANSVGGVMAELPLSTEVKDMYDCAILRAVGTPQPASATVIKVCGFTPAESKAAPLAIAITELKEVTTCPSLLKTVSRALVALQPLIALVEGSSQPTVRIIGIALRVAMSPLQALLGSVSPCSN